MIGINLNKDIKYIDASMRYFEKGEFHITRTTNFEVLVMVFDGVLRFSEDGTEYEVYPGQYHIQTAGTFQTASIPSDEPKYLYIHFSAQWCENSAVLQKTGEFDCKKFFPKMEALDKAAKGNFTKIEAASVFYEILSQLFRSEKQNNITNAIADFIFDNYKNKITLDALSKKFNFSKNHIINLFKKDFGITPVEYINRIRLKESERLLATTTYSMDNIAYDCGFGDYSQFYKSFYRKTGVSPRKWRELHQI